MFWPVGVTAVVKEMKMGNFKEGCKLLMAEPRVDPKPLPTVLAPLAGLSRVWGDCDETVAFGKTWL